MVLVVSRVCTNMSSADGCIKMNPLTNAESRITTPRITNKYLRFCIVISFVNNSQTRSILYQFKMKSLLTITYVEVEKASFNPEVTFWMAT
jgi:hypothetical protein